MKLPRSMHVRAKWAFKPYCAVTIVLLAPAGLGGGGAALYWDPVKGIVLGLEECLRAHPRMQQTSAAAAAPKQALLRVFTELLRTAVVSHQRKGDSDAVAHCLHQLLALDLADPGWEPILQRQL